MDKRTVKLVVIVAMLLVACLYFVGGTYARYTSSFDGTATVSVAKWAVKVNSSEEKNFELELKQEKNDFVVDGKIAPDVTLKSDDVVIDLTGTEVAVDVKAEVDQEQLSSALTQLGASAEDVKPEVKVYKGESGESEEVSDGKITLPEDGQAFKEENGKFHLAVQVKWTNNPDHDESDTTAGKTSAKEPITLSIPVKVTLQQHLASDDDP